MPSGIYTKTEKQINAIKNYWLGKKRPPFSEETKRKMSIAKRGIKHINLKPVVSYSGIHKWVRTELGKSKKCKHCGIENIFRKDGRSLIHWANKSHEYKRVKTDWISLCAKCHAKYDKRYRRSLK